MIRIGERNYARLLECLVVGKPLSDWVSAVFDRFRLKSSKTVGEWLWDYLSTV